MFPGQVPSDPWKHRVTRPTKVASARVANVALVAVRDAGRATRSVVKPRPKVDTVEKVEEECKGGVHPSVGNVLRTVQII